MLTLGQALQKTIRNLEQIRDLQPSPSDGVFTKLDTLYAQQIDLIDAAIQKAAPEYAKATISMNEAAQKTQGAIDGLAKLEQAIGKIADAIGSVDELLAAVVPCVHAEGRKSDLPFCPPR
jgi:conjugal transfer/entry exclusion protein